MNFKKKASFIALVLKGRFLHGFLSMSTLSTHIFTADINLYEFLYDTYNI
jgi:hypothetical protein